MENDKNINFATYTFMGPCTLVGKTPPLCPAGTESVGMTQPGSCMIGNPPGDGHTDRWMMKGYQRVCKKKIPSSGDLAVDCCSNLFGIADSLECKSAAWKPYSWACNTAMAEKCNTNKPKNPYGPNWNGVPYGQDPVLKRPCSGKIVGLKNNKEPGCIDEFCVNYLRNAPPNNFFHNHDFSDVPWNFPQYSYTTPNFFGNTWGHQPLKGNYYDYRDLRNKDANNYCRQFPHECMNQYYKDYRF